MSWPSGYQPFGPNRAPLLTGLSSSNGATPIPVAVDPATGALIVEGGSGGGSTQYTSGGSAVTNPTGNSLIYFNGSNVPVAVTTANPLPITGTISVGSTADESAFTAGTSTTGPVAGVYNDSVAALTSGQQGTIRATTNRALHSNLRNSSGTEIGTSGNPIYTQDATAESSLSSIVTNTSNSATSANQTNGNQQTKLTDGTNIANVVSSSTPNSTGNALLTAGMADPVTFTTTTVQTVAASDVGNYSWVSVQINTQGTSSTVTWQGSNDNTNWIGMALLQPLSTLTSGSLSTATAGVVFAGPLNFRYFRLNVTGISAGTTAGVIVFSSLPRQIVNINGQVALNGTTTIAGLVGTTSAVINVNQKTVSTTAVQLSVTSTVPTNGIIVQALSTNAASIFVGGSGVTTSTGFELVAGQAMSFTCNLNTLYIISASSTTDKVCYNVE